MVRADTVASSLSARSKRNGQITGIVAGQIVAVSDAPTLTGADTPWSGCLLEAYKADTVRQDVWWGWHKTHACLITRGSVSFRIRQFGSDISLVGCKGDVFVFPRGFGETRFSYDKSSFRILCVELDPTSVTFLDEHFDRSIGPQLASRMHSFPRC